MSQEKPWSHGRLVPSKIGYIIEHTDGTPFFWLGDTGWLLFCNLTIEEAMIYFDDRKSKGFNVIQAMCVHELPKTNIYGSTFESIKDVDWKKGPLTSDPENYWNVIDRMISLAEERGIYMALVPVWGSVVKEGHLSPEIAYEYGTWLGSHFRDRPNIIWLNGGDIHGDIKPDIWHALGNAIKAQDNKHIMTFHPFGSRRSAEWFHNALWLDFNMFQSGHRRYDQPPPKREQDTDYIWHSEDNWKYVLQDLNLDNPKPTIDGEPSYEGIPQGLHDPSQPLWTDREVRRYAYWSVLAGAFGITYGNNAVMQMFKPQFAPGSFSVSSNWDEAISDPGSGQIQYLKKLMESFNYRKGAYAPEIIVGDSGEKHDKLIAHKGPNYALIYAYHPRPIALNLNIAFPGAGKIKSKWYNPVDGNFTEARTIESSDKYTFDPPATIGNTPVKDVLLVLTNPL